MSPSHILEMDKPTAMQLEYDAKIQRDLEHDSSITPTPGHHEPPPYVKSLSPEERHRVERALVRKIDIRLIPPIIFMYILNYLDRNNIAAARLAGLERDLKLVGTQYQTCMNPL